jgi:predicted DNA-binding protein
MSYWRKTVGKIDQLDMFMPAPTEVDFIKSDLKEAVELIHRVRKGQYAKIGDIKKMQLEILERLDILERNLCRGKYADL